MKIYSRCIAIVLFAASCTPYGSEVREALEDSGPNREELEHVLKHYRNKGLVAYRSACFLIANMRHHGSTGAIVVDSSLVRFFGQTDSLRHAVFLRQTVEEARPRIGIRYDSLCREWGVRFSVMDTIDPTMPRRRSDLQTLKSDFLITNIDAALEIWRERGYSYPKDFDFFKEFVLPYRTSNEHLVYDRSALKRLFSEVSCLSPLQSDSLIVGAYKEYIKKCRWINKFVAPKHHLGVYDLLVSRFKMDCHNMMNWSSNVLRSCGVPTGYEFTPQWVDQDSRHFWCVSPDTQGILQPYTAPENGPGEDWDLHIRYAGKVYRRTFGAQENTPPYIASADEYVPELFHSPLLSDQTFRYHQTVTLRLPLDTDTNNRLAYLNMFSTRGDTPVAWGRIDKRKREIVFEQVPLNILFFPVYYDEQTPLSIGQPFLLQASSPHPDIPLPRTRNDPPSKSKDLTLRAEKLLLTDNPHQEETRIVYRSLSCSSKAETTLRLLRKYPEKRHLKKILSQLQGASFLGSNDRQHWDTLHTLETPPAPYLQEIRLQCAKPYRYYFFFTLDYKPVNIAHMEFLGHYSPKHICVRPTPLPIFSDSDKERKEHSRLFRIKGTPARTGPKSHQAFNDDVSNFSESSNVGMDFGTPVRVSHIRFIPRTANNGIVPGNTYALWYYDREWKLFKTCAAQWNYLDFNNVPSERLYWLRNLSDGKDELPFFYADGTQYFLHVDTPVFKTNEIE